MTSAQTATRRPLSRRALLTLVWVGALVILGLIGLRTHAAELVGVSATPEVSQSAAISNASADTVGLPGGDQHAANGSTQHSDNQQSSHLGLLTICMLGMLAGVLLVVLFTRRPWLQIRLNRLRESVIAMPRAPARSQPLLLLHSISRT